MAWHNRDLFAYHPDGRVTTLLGAEAIRYAQVGLSRWGMVVAFNRASKGTIECARMKPDGSEIDAFTTTVENPLLAPYQGRIFVSPNEDVCALIGNDPDESRETRGVAQVFLVDLHSGAVRLLTSFLDPDYAGSSPVALSWSPDGTLIAFYHAESASYCDPRSQNYSTYVTDLSGNVKRLAEPCRRNSCVYGSFPVAGPLWHPTMRVIYVAANYEPYSNDNPVGSPITYSVSIDDGQIQKIAPGFPSAIAPDGRYLYCSSGLEPSRAGRVRVDLTSRVTSPLGEDWQSLLLSASGKLMAGFWGNELVILREDGSQSFRWTDRSRPLPPGPGSSLWVSVR